MFSIFGTLVFTKMPNFPKISLLFSLLTGILTPRRVPPHYVVSQTFLSDQTFRAPRANARECGAFARAPSRTRLFGARFTRLWGKISPRSGGAIFRYPQSGLARGPDRFALAQDRFACRRVTAPMTAVSTSDAETRATNPDASLRFCKSAWKHSSGIARPACWRASR